MIAECVLDTNVLVYACSSAEEDAPKRARAIELIEDGEFGTSAQVLQEFYVSVTRKIRVPMPPAVALEWIEQLARQPCASIDATLVMRAVEISETFKISYWDGAIIAAADALGATTLYTEDLNDGQLYGNVRAVNPFKAA
jgi:predicted nucleic acid-binding protein